MENTAIIDYFDVILEDDKIILIGDYNSETKKELEHQIHKLKKWVMKTYKVSIAYYLIRRPEAVIIECAVSNIRQPEKWEKIKAQKEGLRPKTSFSEEELIAWKDLFLRHTKSIVENFVINLCIKYEKEYGIDHHLVNSP